MPAAQLKRRPASTTPGSASMGAQSSYKSVEAIFRFNTPDPAITADHRALFSLAAPKEVQEIKLPLHDIRTATYLPSGRECLDKHGFALVSHPIPESAWASRGDVESTYIPAITDLVKSVTGCKTVLVNNVAFRRKAVDMQADPMFYHKKGGDFDKLGRTISTERPFVLPPDSKSVEPARGMHIDYSLTGLRATIRNCRADFHDAGAAHLAAVDSASSDSGGSNESTVIPPRVAAYSVWRPLKRVTRDPIAVLDYQTARPDRWHAFEYRSTGYKGDYLLEAYSINAPEEGEEVEQKWHYVSEQMPDEVMLIKFADSESEVDPSVAKGCGHGSPAIVGQVGDTRESMEARVLAFW